MLSEGIHSFLDLVSAAVSFFTVREAGKPADQDHPFGHGKIETLSSLFEALLLLLAAFVIVYEAFDHLLNPQPVTYQGWAMGVIVVSLLVSWFMYVHNLRASVETESSALKLNALHFLSDVVASGAVLLGLVVLRFTGWLLVDPIMAFGVAGYILLIGGKQVLDALRELSDSKLPEAEVREIESVLGGFKGKSIEAHDLRTRRSGATRHVDFHLVTCGWMTVDESHSVCDEIERRLETKFTHLSLNIHVEPCGTDRAECKEHCHLFQRVKEKDDGKR